MDDEHCYRAVQSRDGRFDGAFFTAVTTTGIYCRPSCPAITPKRPNVRFFPSAAAAQEAGFRACKRCRPDAAPGSPEWNQRADLVGRAMRLIADGVVEREGVAGLAQRLHYSERQLHRQIRAEVGAGPLALARAHRVQSARTLLETTDLPVSDVAFAAGFASIRQFNDTVRQVFAATPTALRTAAARGRRPPTGPGHITVRLAYRPPMAFDHLLDWLAARAVPGIEACVEGEYWRVLRLPHGTGVAALREGGPPGSRPALDCTLHLDDIRDFATAIQRMRRLADLDADPVAVERALGSDPLVGGFVQACPGVRVPGSPDGFEAVTRAVLGQQVSLRAARKLAGVLVAAHGQPLAQAASNGIPGPLTHAWPAAEALAAADPANWPMPATRRLALATTAAAVAVGKVDLDPGADRDDTERALMTLPGVGPWTASYVRMRALGDPDAFPATDLGVRRAIRRLTGRADPAAALAVSEAWRPWRAYATHHLWAATAAPNQTGSIP